MKSGATAVQVGARRSITGSQVAELPAIPWSSRTTGPTPDRRKTIRWPWMVTDSVTVRPTGASTWSPPPVGRAVPN